MKTKDHTIKFILDNIKMSDKRVQRVITDVIKYFDEYSYGENPVVELLTGASFKEVTAFNVNVLRINATKVAYYDDVDEKSIQITGINNVAKCLYISWYRKYSASIYETNVSFETYEHYAKEYANRPIDDAADDTAK